MPIRTAESQEGTLLPEARECESWREVSLRSALVLLVSYFQQDLPAQTVGGAARDPPWNTGPKNAQVVSVAFAKSLATPARALPMTLHLILAEVVQVSLDRDGLGGANDVAVGLQQTPNMVGAFTEWARQASCDKAFTDEEVSKGAVQVRQDAPVRIQKPLLRHQDAQSPVGIDVSIHCLRYSSADLLYHQLGVRERRRNQDLDDVPLEYLTSCMSGKLPRKTTWSPWRMTRRSGYRSRISCSRRERRVSADS